MDNLSQQLQEMLDDYLDQKLSPEQVQKVTALLQTDSDARQALEDLQLTRAMIRVKGIEERVRLHHRKNMENMVRGEMPEVRTVSISRNKPLLVWRAAAAIAILVVMGTLLQLLTVSADRIYTDNYLSYNLPIVRNENISYQTNLDSLFRKRNFEAVISEFKKGDSVNNRNLFLAGMAYLEKGQAQDAIPLFIAIQDQNRPAPEKTFEEESEYYLALAYLKTNQPEKSDELFQKIRSNKRHLFYHNVSGWEMWKLKLLRLKS